jgi:hypothetical protein
MNAKRFSLLLVGICLSLSMAEQASAYYAAHMGRWLTRDPIGYRGGNNLYGYVNAQPTYYVDPLGYGQVVVGPSPSPGFPIDGLEGECRAGSQAYCRKTGATYCDAQHPYQLRECLDKQTECVDELHIVGHGGPKSGNLYIGPLSRPCSKIKPSDSPSRLDGIFDDLNMCTGRCEIILHGCGIAMTSGGQQLMKEIAKRTGCMVTAANSQCIPTPNDLPFNPKDWISVPPPPLWRFPPPPYWGS